MPRSASTGMAVQHLAEHASRQSRAVTDDRAEQALGPAAATARGGAADVAVAQLALLGAPGELERAQALLVPVGAAEVERAHPVLAPPPDRLHEQQVVR